MPEVSSLDSEELKAHNHGRSNHRLGEFDYGELDGSNSSSYEFT